MGLCHSSVTESELQCLNISLGRHFLTLSRHWVIDLAEPRLSSVRGTAFSPAIEDAGEKAGENS